MTGHLAALIAALAPAPALAEGVQRIACKFTSECVDTRACTQVDHRMTMVYRHGTSGGGFLAADPTRLPRDPFTVEVSDPDGGFRAAAVMDGDFGGPMTGFIGFAADRTQRLLTITGGIGRYSVHMRDAGRAIYREGTCSEVGAS